MTEDTRLVAGRYQVGELVGRGGMSDVHKGVDTRLGRTVAIKLLKTSLATDPVFRTRFRQEAQAAARMAHPTIVRVFDAGEETITGPGGAEAQLPFIVMEYVEGTLLRDIIKRGPLDPSEAVRITEGILTALEYSHRAGVVHRDIKPGNVMITKTGQVKVMDFGIARAISDSSTTVAQTTAILGTASYFSPEQAKGETVDARTDLYSTGVVLFEMLTGKPPFRAETPVAVAYQHVSETPVKPSSINSRVSPALDTVVMRALAKDRFERYQSAAEFRDDVEIAGQGRVPIHKTFDETAGLFGAPPPRTSGSELALKQLTEDDRMVRTQNRPPVVWIWAGIASIAVIIFAVVFWVLSLTPTQVLPDTSREVPNLAGMTYDQAQTALQEDDLAATRVDVPSETVEVDQVIETMPPAGTIVSPGQVVKVSVSTGKQPVEIPDLTNLPLGQAEAALATAGLTLGTVDRENSPTVLADVVLRSDPAAKAAGHAGDTVNLVVSSGVVTIPDVVGQPLGSATVVLTGESLQLVVTPQPDPACPAQPGSPVTQQSLAPGDVPQKSAVTLTYCAGDAQPEAPAG
ncbi:Stk1 family PASTA domain-containing Ser/Thr kinase [Compostimonas suwonensis]|uniref:non-specific serine/threonine protein kinase n=1 Tax=Compostimonas suwonensis TaxID=1048394 RepID=A0A2M9C466_9MICO|nr:Stk1 family PASTA domain-containing Ser/Thr kinase [Compostimonas suwonensis]PJJ65279.1 serine/threonine-protein kinase [Compostimonas suwonensis]